MQIELVFGVILGPRHFLEAIGFCVNELGVLRNRLVRVTGGRREKKRERSHSLTGDKSTSSSNTTGNDNRGTTPVYR